MATQSLVDYLKSNNKDSSLTSRAQLAVDNGLVKNTQEYISMANAGTNGDINTKLLAKLSGGGSPSPTVTPPATVNGGSTPTTPVNVNNLAQANAYINSGQSADQATAAKASDVPVRSSTQSYMDIFNNIQSAVNKNLPAKPAATNFTSDYTGMLSSYGINDLETQLNTLKDEENQIRDTFTSQKNNEQGKPVAMNVIEGRVSEEEKAANERLATNLRLQTNITNQLKTKYDVVNNIMSLKKLDYQTASDDYNTAFTQNMQMYNLVKGISDDQKSDAEKATDTARANLQVMYNAIQNGGLSISNLSSDQKLQIQKLEMQSGLPVGFYESFQSKNPKADIVTSTTRETNGAKYVDIITRDATTGALSTKSMYVGKVDTSSSGGSKPTDAQVVKSDASKVASQLNSRTGADGYVAPEDYMTARRAWVSAGYTAADFDTRFGKTYVNPLSYDTVSLSESALK